MHSRISVFFRRLIAPALLVFAPAIASAQDQSVTITGRVTGAANEALPAVSVLIADLGISAYTGNDGTYRLVVPAARARGQEVALTARSIGRQSRSNLVRLTPGTTVTQNFMLPADPLRLEQVIITAGAEAVAERVGTVRANVDAATITKSNETNVVQALAGKVPGVLTHEGSGDAGASTSIQIRGAKTFGTSQPTFIIDGVVMNNATRNQAALNGAPAPNRAIDINPEDVASIEILKGAAASSIYGASVGSAGAIVITTKRGQGGRTQYTLRSNYQTDKAIKTQPTQMLYGVGTGCNAAGVDGVASGGITCLDTYRTNCINATTGAAIQNCSIGSNFFSWGPKLAPTTPVYDHGSEVFEQGNSFDNSISMSGGSDRTTFYLSMGALRDNGFIVGDKDYFNRYSVRFNGSHALRDDLTVGASGSYVQTGGSGADRGNTINGVGLSSLRQPPNFNALQYLDPTTGLHRSWRFPNPGPNSALGASFNRGFDNPFYALNEDALLAETGRYFGNLNAKWTPLQWLAVNWTLGGDYTSDDRTYGYALASSGKNNGEIERWQFYDRIIDHNLTATATKSFNTDIQGGLTLGQNLNETYFRQIDIFAQTLIAPAPYKLSNTVSRTTPNDAESRRRVDGYFGQATLDLYDQLFLAARLRNDGSSAFGEGNQRAYYPGASAAWSFTKKLNLPQSLISFGKLRAAYGESGQQPPLYATQDVFITTVFADFNPASLQAPTLNGIGGLYASAVKGNPDIKPERVREFEAGVDLSLWNGNADLSVTGYSSKSQDVIFQVPLPPSTGYTNVNLNAGALTNKGVEVSSSIRPFTRDNFSFELGMNWGKNTNLVTSLGATDRQLAGTDSIATLQSCGTEARQPRCVTGLGNSFSGQTTHAQVGFPLGVWRSSDFARCGRGLTTVTFAGTTHDVGTACAGAPDGALYIAANGFPITDPTQRAIGNPWPDWTAGISGTMKFRGIEVSAFLDHRQGGDVLNMTRSSMDQYGTHEETLIRGEQRTFGVNMQCYNKTCDVLNGPTVGPGKGTAVTIGEGWYSGGNFATQGNGQGATGGPITTRLEDATNTRLREVSLSYTFRQPWVSRIAGSESIDVKLAGRNLVLWTKYSGLDPETNLGGAANANRGIDFFNTPLSRGLVVSVAIHH
jgi:TonB-linked SusC/RagA family outer membrane protein